MTALRAVLGPVLIAGEKSGWSGPTLAWLVVTALISDIFDGVLARRWHCDTAAVRLFDTLADTMFYLCVGIALWIGPPGQPQLLRSNMVLLAATLIAEAMNFGLAFLKFGKPASYHSYLAKTWGLVMATAVVAVLASRHAGPLFPLALALGIACNLEGLAMSLVLPVWHKDVKTLLAAVRLRAAIEGRAITIQPQTQTMRRRLTPKTTASVAASALLALGLIAAPAHAIEPGHAAYWGGTAAVARDTIGSFDTTSATSLRFQYKKADGSAGQVEMEYDKVFGIEPSQETKHPLGVLPFIAVSLLAHPQQRYLVTIRYSDAEGTAQIAEFELPRRDQQIVVAIVNARSPRNCGVRNYPCPALTERRLP